MNVTLLKSATLFALLAVMLGAFGAHALKKIIDADGLDVYDTAVKYQFYHAIGIFIAGILAKDFHSGMMKYSGYFFIAGIFLFSGSLYFLTYLKAHTNDQQTWVVYLTPVGGIFFMIGWILLLVGLKKSNKLERNLH